MPVPADAFINSFIINIQYLENTILKTVMHNEEIKTYSSIIYVPISYQEINHKYQTEPIKLLEKGVRVIYIED